MGVPYCMVTGVRCGPVGTAASGSVVANRSRRLVIMCDGSSPVVLEYVQVWGCVDMSGSSWFWERQASQRGWYPLDFRLRSPASVIESRGRVELAHVMASLMDLIWAAAAGGMPGGEYTRASRWARSVASMRSQRVLGGGSWGEELGDRGDDVVSDVGGYASFRGSLRGVGVVDGEAGVAGDERDMGGGGPPCFSDQQDIEVVFGECFGDGRGFVPL